MPEPAEPRWLLLIHQIPPKPSYLRVKVGRRLQGLGAVAVKNSVYVLPRSDQALEDFQWVRREIVAGGGDASVCEARFVEGLSDAAVEALFNAAREADYARADPGGAPPPGRASTGRGKRPAGDQGAGRGGAAAAAQAARREWPRSTSSAPRGRETVGGAAGRRRGRAAAAPTEAATAASARPRTVRGRTWVTRTRRARRPHRERLAHPALHRSRGALQVRPRPGVRARSRASCASTCSRPSSPTRATSARSRCCCAASGSRTRRSAPDRRDRPRHRPEGRQVRAAGGGRHRPPDRRDRHAPQGRRGAARATAARRSRRSTSTSRGRGDGVSRRSS